MAGIFFYIRSQKIPFRELADVVAPVVFLAYGLGRIGCHLAGDGDYGLPTTSWVGTIYAEGTAKPTYVYAEYFERYPEERVKWHYDSLKAIPAGTDVLGQRITRFDEVTPAHPTPIYEFIAAFVLFQFLWRKRQAFEKQAGKLFGLTMILLGIERFAVEFLRINPLYAGLSMAQWISIGLVIAGGILFSKKQKAGAKQ
jgi:prolipoprotein diacylglyceryltransferase